MATPWMQEIQKKKSLKKAGEIHDRSSPNTQGAKIQKWDKKGFLSSIRTGSVDLKTPENVSDRSGPIIDKNIKIGKSTRPKLFQDIVGEHKGESFVEKMDAESLAAFSAAAKLPYGEQACFFLDAFWYEFGDQAPMIFYVLYEHMKMADMRWRNIQYLHLYEDGDDLDFDAGLYVFEQLCKFLHLGDKTTPACSNGKKWAQDYPKGVPTEMTAVTRKKELRDKVDVNFDGRISFLEFLLYQFNASPKTLMLRSTGRGQDPPEVVAAKAALAEVHRRVQAYEAEKHRLTVESELNGGKGTKALKAKNELAQLNSSPLWDALNKALITAEAQVRIAVKKYGGSVALPKGGAENKGSEWTNAGTLWWMEETLKVQKARYQ
jgi:hypothetical protein